MLYAFERPLNKEETVQVLQDMSDVVGRCLDQLFSLEPAMWLLMSSALDVGNKHSAEVRVYLEVRREQELSYQ